ncbi:MAG: M10 family metallopeptidase C-terminal domain-containing protein [Bauldia sp.]|nr:M10 family metallopeptidase C-terminal domain-containing protein [Bauldia sp.]
MPGTKFVTATGDVYVDGLLSGRGWNTGTLTFSFPSSASFYGSGYGSGEPANGFEAFNATQQSAVRGILGHYAGIINLAFHEVTETSVTHGDLRFAESDAPSTAWGYYPSGDAEGGDSWYNSSGGDYDNPVLGTYAYLTLLHEIGHALGLKHPHEAGFYGAVPADRDSLEYSVMSYRSYIDSPLDYYRNGYSSFPQSLMMLDIAALQQIYGANYNTNADDTVYRWSPATGQMYVDDVGQGLPAGNKVFLTVWDGGGRDTYDFSAYGNALKVDLDPGAWSTISSSQLASLGNGRVAAGNIANALLYKGITASLIEDVIGGNGNDTIAGNGADNTLAGGPGNDVLSGRGGDDTAVFSGDADRYEITLNGNGTWTISDLRDGSPDGTDTLSQIEYFMFRDTVIDGDAAAEKATTTGLPPDVVAATANHEPVARKDVFFARKGTELNVAVENGVLANDSDEDGDALTAAIHRDPRKGKVDLDADGSFVFKVGKKFTGKVKFKYAASDGETVDKAKVVVKVLKRGDYDDILDAGGLTASLDSHGLDSIPAPVPVAGNACFDPFRDGSDHTLRGFDHDWLSGTGHVYDLYV